MEYLDSEGYPTEEYLDMIRNADEHTDIDNLLEIVLSNWMHGQMGYKLGIKHKGIRKLELHTLGWSGNEAVITEIINNVWLTHFKMKYYKWEVGGHYYFEIRY